MEPYLSPFQKNDKSLRMLAKQGIFALFLTILIMSYALIFAIILIPIGIVQLLKKSGKLFTI